ncbi:dihydroxyacetone kinase family protein [Georgenia sp. EYE_87]|uniref:dihydroxyacetone kinase family protein n=1 Tax=Georgenia sp. EYE_87 TaxID=2853448 RepID=UPI00200675BA|nr:dihydroxyacetone kinase family protein [Georgenia sp. EYE_87]MCK6210422.1 dihydroxyacetone kinase family protein [Georgenia sp. EYE_87]
MTRLYNDPKQFSDEALAGMALAHPGHVQRVHGGVVRSTDSPRGSVSVVVGGGSGHYPAFAGWVGPGLAHGAACGNVFASPSASQVYSVVRAADNGGGVLLLYGNYAGDVLHFGQAAERLRAEGLDVRTLAVSDDVASNTPENHRDRRGVTGDLVVLKVTGAAAERGDDLDAVERLARRANDRTRSLGVAFNGCTLPGAAEPLFRVPAGVMSVGLGVHGEPGVRDVPMGTAAEVADLLVDGVLAEEPPRGRDGYEGRAVVILNGLGTVKNEELYVVYGRVAQRLEDAGLTPVLPEVGELMSSLDMAGLSLTVTFLDPELEELWVAPVDTIAYRRGAVQERGRREVTADAVAAEPIPEASAESRELAQAITDVLEVLRATAVAAEPELGRLDAIAGDGDHGQGMSYGTTGAWRAASDALARGAGARTLLVRAGEAWSEAAGGTSGALWGGALTAAGAALSDDAPAASADIVRAVEQGGQAVQRLGGAEPGDKTMVDALVPFTTVLTERFASGDPLPRAWAQAAEAASHAARATAEIQARRGRSRVLGEKSVGTPDPGATSFALLMSAVAESGLLEN